MKSCVVSNALLLFVLAAAIQLATSSAKDIFTSVRRNEVKKITTNSYSKIAQKAYKNPRVNKQLKADKGPKKEKKYSMNKKKKSKTSKCENFPTVSSLDLERYAGRWYQIYGTDSPFVGKRCNTANYVYNPPNPMFGTPPMVSIVNTAFCSPGEFCPPPYGVYFNVTGFGMPNPGIPNEAGKFLVTLNSSPERSTTFNYFVLDVVSDPDSNETAPYKFAAVIDPYFPGGAITILLSRENTIDPNDEDTVALILGKVKSAGISLENIVRTEHEDVCVYDA